MSETWLSASVIQRGRGVYLAEVRESRDGIEDHEAFSTAEKAKRWCAEWHCRERLVWDHSPAIPGKRWASWSWDAEVEDDEQDHEASSQSTTAPSTA